MPLNDPNLVLVALGSNQGDRLGYLNAAVEALTQHPRLRLGEVILSSIYETPALLPEGADEAWNIPYLNQVMMARLQGDATPQDILRILKETEQRLGRQKRGHWGPREIDLDLLALGDTVLDTPELTLPHPRMTERDFVMVPLTEIAPDWRYPGAGEAHGKTAKDWLEHSGHFPHCNSFPVLYPAS